MMGTTSSTTVQSLGEIEQRAPAVGAKIIWCLYVCYAALLPRRGPHIASHSVRPSVCPSVPCLFTLEPSYERTSKIEKLRFSLMGQRHVCTFRHAQRAAYRTAISAAAQTCQCWGSPWLNALKVVLIYTRVCSTGSLGLQFLGIPGGRRHTAITTTRRY